MYLKGGMSWMRRSSKLSHIVYDDMHEYIKLHPLWLHSYIPCSFWVQRFIQISTSATLHRLHHTLSSPIGSHFFPDLGRSNFVYSSTACNLDQRPPPTLPQNIQTVVWDILQLDWKCVFLYTTMILNQVNIHGATACNRSIDTDMLFKVLEKFCWSSFLSSLNIVLAIHGYSPSFLYIYFQYGIHQLCSSAAGGWDLYLCGFGCRCSFVWSVWRYRIFRFSIMCVWWCLSISKPILLSMCWGYCDCDCHLSSRIKHRDRSYDDSYCFKLKNTSFLGHIEEEVLFNFRDFSCCI